MLEIQPSTIVWTVINLLVLYLFFKKYLYGRIMNILDKRAKLVEDSITESEKQLTEAEKLRAEYESRLYVARQEAENIVDTAKKRADNERERALLEAQEDAYTIIKQAHTQGEREKEELLQQAREEVVSLTMLAASKLAGKTLDSTSDGDIIDKFLSESGDSI